jgi:molecular chaperone GrpE
MVKKKSADERHDSTDNVESGDYNATSDTGDGMADESNVGQAESREERSAESGSHVMASAGETELVEKLSEMQDRYLRLSAEFDNYRKRTLREKIEITRNAAEPLLLRLLPVVDDFERGMSLLPTVENSEAMKEGFNLVYTKFRNFLEQSGVTEIDALHQDFNVDLHDAITKIPAPDKKKRGKVLDVIQKGYYLNDKVIRFSKVIVGE